MAVRLGQAVVFNKVLTERIDKSVQRDQLRAFEHGAVPADEPSQQTTANRVRDVEALRVVKWKRDPNSNRWPWVGLEGPGGPDRAIVSKPSDGDDARAYLQLRLRHVFSSDAG